MLEMNNEDKDLQELFHGEEKPLHPDTLHITLGTPVAKKKTQASVNTTNKEKTEQKPKDEPVDTSWCPAKPKPNEMDKLKGCVKWLAMFGGLSFLIFYWNEAGLMASSIAIPSMCICTALAGWGVGKTVGDKK